LRAFGSRPTAAIGCWQPGACLAVDTATAPARASIATSSNSWFSRSRTPVFVSTWVGEDATAIEAVVLPGNAPLRERRAGLRAAFFGETEADVRLATADPDEADRTVLRAGFERRWNRWNRVRTRTSTAAFTCLDIALAGR
jgi:hypothetical protein